VNPARLISEPDAFKKFTATGCNKTRRTQQRQRERQRDRVSITVGVHAELNQKSTMLLTFLVAQASCLIAENRYR